MKYLYYIVAILCLFPFVSAPMALFCGILFSLLKIEKPFQFKKYSSPILQYSVVLMGFGMNLQQVIEVSSKGIILTACSVLLVFLLGVFLGKILKVERNTTFLISSGTAICGGSAIAAVSPIVGAKDSQISFSLTVVFVLNAIALFIFPFVGHYFNMGQESFGYWSAIAIHDTSSVVATGYAFSEAAGDFATMVKLTRTLSIIPTVVAFAFIQLRLKKKEMQKISGNTEELKANFSIKKIFPWFIIGFVAMSVVASIFTIPAEIVSGTKTVSKFLMVSALAAIGLNTSFSSFKKSGIRPMIHGFIISALVVVVALVVEICMGIV